MKFSQKQLIKIIKEEQETVERMREQEDPEGEMAAKQAEMALSAASEIAKIVDNMEELEDWVQAKLTLATDYLQTVRDYLAFQDHVKTYEAKKQEEE